MTTEIAILNKSAIALAADSAVTITGPNGQSKIFNTVNKLFALSKYHPVGIMIFDNAQLMGMPWETIIKMYRSKLGQIRFPTVQEYAEHFLKFLNDNPDLFPESVQAESYTALLNFYFSQIKEAAMQACDQYIHQNGSIEEAKVLEILVGQIHSSFMKIDGLNELTNLPYEFATTIANRYKEQIQGVREDVFGKVSLPKQSDDELHKIATSLVTKEYFPERGNSGIVIAGFGEAEPFPSLRSYILQGVFANKVKFRPFKDSTISFRRHAIITSFAQDEMVHIFMQGVDPSYEYFIETTLHELFEKHWISPLSEAGTGTADDKAEMIEALRKVQAAAFAELKEKCTKHKRKHYINSVLDAVAALPKDELAAMAESLINLTVLKRKVSMTLETVGGAIDVAVISKGDGLIWIKRKHYFDQQLNAQFLANYYRKDEEA
ncbi:MAG: hypothetical protein AB7G68_19165 [Nitrospiraceae bacterium]